MLSLLLLLAALLLPTPTPDASPPPGTYLYKVTTYRATPGRMLELIELLKAQRTALPTQGDAAPILMRHTQGDQWDVLVMYPLESYAAYYAPDRMARRAEAAEANAAVEAQFKELVAWREDLYAFGPDLAAVQQRLDGTGFFHVEMFKALPGKHDELFRQREMENAYLAGIDRPLNHIFVRDQGAAFDAFTIGYYRDLKHFAESVDIPIEAEDRAAKAAGFESVYAISPYLRSLIAYHHDTLAVVIQ